MREVGHFIELSYIVYQALDLFHNNSFPSGLQPEHRKLVHEL